MRVADLLKSKGTTVITIHDEISLAAAVDILSSKNIGALLVLNAESHVVGMLSERQIIQGLARHGTELLHLPVREVMSEHVFICRPEDQIKEIMGIMTRQRVRHIAVVDEGQLKGIVSIGDVIKYRLDEIETEANILREIIIARQYEV
jgi:CBS domain-containing protein